MHSVLFVATIPNSPDTWSEFNQYVKPRLADDEAVVRLAENVWLLNLQEAIGPLGHLIVKAEQKNIVYGLLPFEREPQWLPAGSIPSTI